MRPLDKLQSNAFRYWHVYFAVIVFGVCGIFFGKWLFGIPLLVVLAELFKRSKIQ